MQGGGGFAKGHEATDTWLPNAPVSQATGHCHAKFNQFLVLCINHDWNVPLCTCSQVCSAYENTNTIAPQNRLPQAILNMKISTSISLHLDIM